MLDHQALIYSSLEEFLTCAVTFVRAGLDRGDAVLVATPHAAALADALGASSGVEIVDDVDWHRVPAWTIGLYARKVGRAARRGGRLRALTELRWHTTANRTLASTSPVPDAEWERYEALLNRALSELPVELCCAYNRAAVTEEVLAAALRTHPSTLDASGVRASHSYRDWVDFPQPPRRPAPPDALRLEFGAAEIPAVRQATLRWARAAGLDEENAQEFLIAVYEIVSNAVEHGGGRGIAQLWSDGTHLLSEVWSARPIPDPLGGYRPPGTAQERGRGLWLARQICEQVTIYNDDGGIVQLVKTIP
jgi:anti-sigma regulatory factor (Ser/Thr protein kinase)